MNLNTNTTGSEKIKSVGAFYDKQLLAVSKPNLVYSQFAQKRNIPKGNSKTVNFRKFSKFPKATQPLTEGVTPDGMELAMTEITATVHQYGAYVTTSDVLNLTNLDPVMAETNKMLGMNAGETLNDVTAQELAAGTNVLYAQNGTSRATLSVESNVLSVRDIKKAAAILKAYNTPKINGDYIAIIHPFATYDIMNDPEWIDVKKYDSKDLYEGEIGSLYGVRFVESTESVIFKGAGANSADVYGTIIVGENAYGETSVEGGGLKTIIKQLGSGGTSDPLEQRSTQGWKALHTAVILNQVSMIRIESASTMGYSDGVGGGVIVA